MDYGTGVGREAMLSLLSAIQRYWWGFSRRHELQEEEDLEGDQRIGEEDHIEEGCGGGERKMRWEKRVMGRSRVWGRKGEQSQAPMLWRALTVSRMRSHLCLHCVDSSQMFTQLISLGPTAAIWGPVLPHSQVRTWVTGLIHSHIAFQRKNLNANPGPHSTFFALRPTA